MRLQKPMATHFVFHHRVVDAEKAREYLSRVGETLAPLRPRQWAFRKQIQIEEKAI